MVCKDLENVQCSRKKLLFNFLTLKVLSLNIIFYELSVQITVYFVDCKALEKLFP